MLSVRAPTLHSSLFGRILGLFALFCLAGCAAPPPKSAFDKALAARLDAGGQLSDTQGDDEDTDDDKDEASQDDIADTADAGPPVCKVGAACEVDCSAAGPLFVASARVNGAPLQGPVVAPIAKAQGGGYFVAGGGPGNGGANDSDLAVHKFDASGKGLWGVKLSGKGTAGASEDVPMRAIALSDGSAAVSALVRASSKAQADGRLGVAIVSSSGTQVGLGYVEKWKQAGPSQLQLTSSGLAEVQGDPVVATSAVVNKAQACLVARIAKGKVPMATVGKLAPTDQATTFAHVIGGDSDHLANVTTCVPVSVFGHASGGGLRVGMVATVGRDQFEAGGTQGAELIWLEPSKGDVIGRARAAANEARVAVAGFPLGDDVVLVSVAATGPSQTWLHRLNAHGQLLHRAAVTGPATPLPGQAEVALLADRAELYWRFGSNYPSLAIALGSGHALKTAWGRRNSTAAFSAAFDSAGGLLLGFNSTQVGDSKVKRTDPFGNTKCAGVCAEDKGVPTCAVTCATRQRFGCDDGNPCTVDDCVAEQGCAHEGAELLGKACADPAGCGGKATCTGSGAVACKSEPGSEPRFEKLASEPVDFAATDQPFGFRHAVADPGSEAMWLAGSEAGKTGTTTASVLLVAADGSTKPAPLPTTALTGTTKRWIIDLAPMHGGGALVCGHATDGKDAESFAAMLHNDGGAPKLVWSTTIKGAKGTTCAGIASMSSGQASWVLHPADGSGPVLQRLQPKLSDGSASVASPSSLGATGKGIAAVDLVQTASGRVVIALHAASTPDKQLFVAAEGAKDGELELFKAPAHLGGAAPAEAVIPVAIARLGAGVAVLTGFKSHVGAQDMSIVALDSKMKPLFTRHFRTKDVAAGPSVTIGAPTDAAIWPTAMREAGDGLLLLARVEASKQSPPLRYTWVLRTDSQAITQLSTNAYAPQMQTTEKPFKHYLASAVAPFPDGSIGLSMTEHTVNPLPAEKTKGKPMWARLDAFAATPPQCAHCDSNCSPTDKCETVKCVGIGAPKCLSAKKLDCSMH